jgi:hypothetical protein
VGAEAPPRDPILLDEHLADVVGARYVKYVGHMNSQNNWNAVTEVDILGR